ATGGRRDRQEAAGIAEHGRLDPRGVEAQSARAARPAGGSRLRDSSADPMCESGAARRSRDAAHPSSPSAPMPPVTTALIVANVAVFLLQTAVPQQLIGPFALWPLATSGRDVGAAFAPWQLVTYAFLHGSLLHLAFNMFALYMFGGAIERV